MDKPKAWLVAQCLNEWQSPDANIYGKAAAIRATEAMIKRMVDSGVFVTPLPVWGYVQSMVAMMNYTQLAEYIVSDAYPIFECLQMQAKPEMSVKVLI